MTDVVQVDFDGLGDMVTYAAEATLTPPERISVADAAEKYRKLNNPGSYVGPWDNSETPYLVEAMNVLTSREVDAAIFVGPAQSGKTAIIENWWLYSVVCDPADMIVYQTAQDTARDFSHRKIDRLHRESTAVGERLMPGSSSDNTYDKFYRTGTISSLSWPSINQLSGKSIPRVAITDLDRMALDIDGEGSVFDLARKRTTSFMSFGMTLAESSPGYEPTDPKWMAKSSHEAPPCPGILSLYNRGDRRRWYWPCPHCGEYFEGSFSLLMYDLNETDPTVAARGVFMRCPVTGCVIEPNHKYEMNQRGVWLKENETITKEGVRSGTGIVSKMATFWLKGTAARFIKWETLVERYLLAYQEFERTGQTEGLKSTVNTDQSEAFFPVTTGAIRTPEQLKNAATPCTKGDERKVPEGVRCLIATVDVQKNEFVVQITGVSPSENFESFNGVVIDRFKIKKSERLDEDGERYMVAPGSYLEDWDLVTQQVVDREYELIDGTGYMPIKMTFCDSGGRAGVTTKAYDYWRGLRDDNKQSKLLLVKGSSNLGAPRYVLSYPDSDRKDRSAGARGEIPVVFLNTNTLKDQLDGMLDKQEDFSFSENAPIRKTESGGRIFYPSWLPDEFFVELTVESKDRKGRWINAATKRNEAWDLLTYFLGGVAFMRLDKINWNDPPVWADVWNKNVLIRARDSDKPFASKEIPDYGFAKFGAKLG